MQHTAVAAIEAADWDELAPRLQQYAHYQIVGCQWRGLVMTGMKCGQVTINNHTADELVEEALEALASGRRTFRPELSLAKNVKDVIWSLVRNHYKKALNSPVVGHVVREDEDEPLDPIENARDFTIPANPAEADERRQRQRDFHALLTKSVADDQELGLLLMAYEEQIYLPAKVEAATGISAGRVSELKRKLEARAEKTMRQHPQYADLKPL
jgi:DNA-directed RNA polymerase specialized sigma24 family protein